MMMTTASPRHLVSVIMPCWNAAPFVGEAIESALSQTYTPLEVIVVDDGSTDGSREIVQSFGDRVRYQEGAHRGAAAARNMGQELARGDYWLFLDADDVLLPGAAEMLVTAAIAAGADCAYGDSRIVDERLNPTGMRVHKAIDNTSSLKRMILGGAPITSGVLCARSDTATWVKMSCDEFHYFMTRAINGDEFIHVPACTVLIRGHDGQHRVSNQALPTLVSDLANAWLDLEKQLQAKHQLDVEVRALVNNAYLGVYLASRRAGLPELSRSFSSRIVRQELRRHPNFRWVSTAGVCVLGGVHLAAFANFCAGNLTRVSAAFRKNAE